MTINKNYKLCVFDVDGVIVKSDVLYYESAKIHNTNLNRDELCMRISKGGEALFSYIFGNNYSSEDVAWFRKMQKELFAPEKHLYDGIKEILQDISSKYMIAIVSNKPEKIIHHMLSESNMAQYFNKVIGRDSGYATKPDADGINKLIEIFQINRKSVIFFGDSVIDSEACKNADISFAHCRYGFDDNVIPCDYELNDITSIRDILGL